VRQGFPALIGRSNVCDMSWRQSIGRGDSAGVGRCAALLGAAIAMAPARSQGRWVADDMALYGSLALAYDAARERVVLFGHAESETTVADTREWDGLHWVTRCPLVTPSPRWSPAMAFDEARRRVVLFGGADDSLGELADTWEWDGRTWAQIVTAGGAFPRSGHAMAYDSSRHRVVLFGGGYRQMNGQTNPLGDVWEYDGTTWTIWPGSPSPRWNAAMAYDPVSAQIVLFGGTSRTPNGQYVYLADTWTRNGVTWTSVTTAPMPPGGRMAFEPAAQQMVYAAANNGVLETWRRSTTWSRLSPATSPPECFGFELATDTLRSRIVMCGGVTAARGPALDTWEWDGTTWQLSSRPPAAAPVLRLWTAMAYDASQQRCVLFGGNKGTNPLPTDTQEWDGRNWILRTPVNAPSGRQSHAMASEPGGVGVMLFGGGDSYGTPTYGDTWRWAGGNWQQLSPASAPSVRSQHVMALDSVRQRVVLYGGYNATFVDLADTWEWDGANWQQAQPASSPPGRASAAMAFDAARQRCVLFGGDQALFNCLADTWLWDGTLWTQPTIASGPSVRAVHRMVYDPIGQRVLMVGGVWQSPNGWTFVADPYWEWDGFVWQRGTGGGAMNRQGPGIAYDEARSAVVLYGGNGSRRTWVYSGLPERSTDIGAGCGPAGGVPQLYDNGARLGNSGFVLELQCPLSGTAALFAMSLASQPQPLGGGCTLQLAAPLVTTFAVTNGFGHAASGMPVPLQPAFIGFVWFAQAAILDPAGPFAGVSLTQGRQLQVGY
jgi:hypothetical protein